ncbi:DUF5693 family protein [Aminipila sp.]|uniref:DUF5693 family protein n=1 Tax=Aminipila sp. TaxID=2060095 RepID=UPI00289A3BBF|nr:DUF5693 family protein [Aminipila sp.]
MIIKLKKYILLWLIVLIGFISISILCIERYQVESVNNGVHITLDYDELCKLAGQSEHDLKWWISFFHAQGCASVSIKEESLHSLQESNKDLEYDTVESICKKLEWKKEYPKEIVDDILNKTYKNEYFIAKTDDVKLAHFIKEGLENRYPKKFYDMYYIGNINYFVIKSDEEIQSVYKEEKDKIRFGFDDNKIKLIKDSGMDVIFRPINNEKFPQNLVKAYKNELIRHQIRPKVYLFGNNTIIGYPDFDKELSEFMKENKITVALLETPVQRSNVEVAGIEDLTVALNYDAVRTFSMSDYIQQRYKYYNYSGSEEIENTIYRAVTERNIRLVYFKPFKWDNDSYVTNTTEYVRMFKSLKARLVSQGIYIGDFTVMPMNTSNRILVIIAGISLVAIGILRIMQYIRLTIRGQLGMLGLGSLCIVTGMYIAPNTMPGLIAFGASVLFSIISISMFIMQMKKAYIDSTSIKFSYLVFKCISSLLGSFIIVLVGGLYIGGLLSDSRFLLEMDFFRGVKLAQIIPICVATVLYVMSMGYCRKESEIKEEVYYISDLRRLLFVDIKAFYLIILGVAGGILYYYLARTGQETNIVPSDAEMILRNLLENTFLARPRTKEFLTGYPLLMAAYLLAHNKIKFLMYPTIIVGAIGIISVLNTFSHLRTPLYLSLLRSFYGLGLGVVIGILGLFVIQSMINLIKKYKMKNTLIETLNKVSIYKLK